MGAIIRRTLHLVHFYLNWRIPNDKRIDTWHSSYPDMLLCSPVNKRLCNCHRKPNLNRVRRKFPHNCRHIHRKRQCRDLRKLMHTLQDNWQHRFQYKRKNRNPHMH